ncbi:MAG: radical SAM protein, partial [Phycisphaeraceae bacterium]|nr:radical SAM protein [Phycisphaeraceae bacterium]
SARETAATLIPSVGCPLGCNFCATSAMFGGKGKFVNFYDTGDELFHVMSELERTMEVRSFFVMDENFLLHRKRALRLLELMQRHHKPWSLYVFSSANVLRKYSVEEIIGLGISWVWMGLEGKDSQYAKLNGINTRDVVRDLQSHGVRVLGSSIIGLEEHTSDNIESAIDYAISHDTEFHQFMLYTPIPGTPLYAEHSAKGSLLSREEVPDADTHGQSRFNFHHPHIKDGKESDFLLRAFQRDFDINGPSILRLARTTLHGWLRYKSHPDLRVRERFRWEASELPGAYAGALWAAARWFKDNRGVYDRIATILRDIHGEFGVKSRIAAPIAGRFVRWRLRREQRNLDRGRTYEPPTFYEINAAMRALSGLVTDVAQSVEPV